MDHDLFLVYCFFFLLLLEIKNVLESYYAIPNWQQGAGGFLVYLLKASTQQKNMACLLWQSFEDCTTSID